MDVCCWNLNVCNTEIKPYYNQQVLQDWEGNLVKKPRGECKVNIYESGVIGMIELIEMKWKGWLEWLDDLDALNQLKQPLRFADVSPWASTAARGYESMSHSTTAQVARTSSLHIHLTIGVFRVTKLGQNSAKTDFSKCDQNKKRKSLGKTLPKQLFCHWANRVPTWTKHFSKTHPKLGLLFLNSVDTYCTVTVTITSIHLLCPSLCCDPHSIATTTGSEHGQIKARERLSWMITLNPSSVHIHLGMINKMELDLAPSRPSHSGTQTSILQLTLTASLDSC